MRCTAGSQNVTTVIFPKAADFFVKNAETWRFADARQSTAMVLRGMDAWSHFPPGLFVWRFAEDRQSTTMVLVIRTQEVNFP